MWLILHEVMGTNRIAAFAQEFSMQLQLRTTTMTGTESHLQQRGENVPMRCISAKTIHDNAQRDKNPVMLASAPMMRYDLESPISAGTGGVLSKPIDVILGTSERKSTEYIR